MYSCMYVCIHACIDVLCDSVWRSEHSFERCSSSTSEAGYLLFLLLCCWLPIHRPLNFLGSPLSSLRALSLGTMGLQTCHTSSFYHRDLFCRSWGSKSAHLAFAAAVFTVELSCWNPFLRQVLTELDFTNWPTNCQQAAGSHLPPLSSSSSGSQAASPLLFYPLGHWEPKLSDSSNGDHPDSQFDEF